MRNNSTRRNTATSPMPPHPNTPLSEEAWRARQKATLVTEVLTILEKRGVLKEDADALRASVVAAVLAPPLRPWTAEEQQVRLHAMLEERLAVWEMAMELAHGANAMEAFENRLAAARHAYTTFTDPRLKS